MHEHIVEEVYFLLFVETSNYNLTNMTIEYWERGRERDRVENLIRRHIWNLRAEKLKKLLNEPTCKWVREKAHKELIAHDHQGEQQAISIDWNRSCRADCVIMIVIFFTSSNRHRRRRRLSCAQKKSFSNFFCFQEQVEKYFAFSIHHTK